MLRRCLCYPSICIILLLNKESCRIPVFEPSDRVLCRETQVHVRVEIHSGSKKQYVLLTLHKTPSIPTNLLPPCELIVEVSEIFPVCAVKTLLLVELEECSLPSLMELRQTFSSFVGATRRLFTLKGRFRRPSRLLPALSVVRMLAALIDLRPACRSFQNRR